MPKPKRPRDPNQVAKLVVDIATGERENDSRAIDPAAHAEAVEAGRKGGQVRATKLSKQRRSEIARQAAQARWRANH